MREDLPKLKTIVIGGHCFYNAHLVACTNLSNLQTIQLGDHACYCSDEIARVSLHSIVCKAFSLDLPKLYWLQSVGYSMWGAQWLDFVNLPSLKTIHLPHSFHSLSIFHILNIH